MISLNMNLTIPDVQVTRGPQYASNVNSALLSLDSHDHSPGKGVPVPVAGLNINADLSLQGFNLSQVRAVRLINNAATLAGSLDVGAIYAKGGDLYYNNGANLPVKVTAGNQINAAGIGGIGGDYATSGASVTYTQLNKTYSFFSGPGVYAMALEGNLTLSDPSAATLTLTTPARTSVLTDSATGLSLVDTTATRTLLDYRASSGPLALIPNFASDAVPVLVGAMVGQAALDARLPLQVATHGAGSEVYVAANKEVAPGVGLGYLNAVAPGAGKVAATGGILRMFTGDPMLFAAGSTIAGVYDANARWAFSPGQLAAPSGTARVQVLSGSTEDTLLLDAPAGNPSILTMASGGTANWKIYAAASGLIIADNTNQGGGVTLSTLKATSINANGPSTLNTLTLNGQLTSQSVINCLGLQTTNNVGVGGQLTTSQLAVTGSSTFAGISVANNASVQGDLTCFSLTSNGTQTFANTTNVTRLNAPNNSFRQACYLGSFYGQGLSANQTAFSKFPSIAANGGASANPNATQEARIGMPFPGSIVGVTYRLDSLAEGAFQGVTQYAQGYVTLRITRGTSTFDLPPGPTVTMNGAAQPIITNYPMSNSTFLKGDYISAYVTVGGVTGSQTATVSGAVTVFLETNSLAA